MIAQAQIAAILTVLDLIADEGINPERPRVCHIPADVQESFIESGLMSEDEYRSRFGDGTIVLVGANDPDMADCDCGHSHIRYTSIAADGSVSPFTTSGTFGELLTTPDPVRWDNATDLDPDAFARML